MPELMTFSYDPTTRAATRLWPPVGDVGIVWYVKLCLAILISLTAAIVSALGQTSPQAAGPESLFGLDNVIDVHFHMELEEWEKMQLPDGTKMDILTLLLALEEMVNDSNAGKHFRYENARRPGLAGYLGIDHQYGTADVTIDGETISGGWLSR